MIERIVIGCGTIEKSGLKLTRGVLYECDTTNGGNEKFWAITPSNLTLTAHSLRRLRNKHHITINVENVGALLDWLRTRKGLILNICGTGARDEIRGYKAFETRIHGLFLATGNEDT